MSDRWCWFGFVDADPDGVLGAADVEEIDGTPAGRLAAWPAHGPRVSRAAKLDPRVVDPGGPPMAISLALAPRGVKVLFDDPAVVAATRSVLSRPTVAFTSTLVRDAAHIAGAVCGIEADTARRWIGWYDDDPFARVLPARRLQVGAGLFGCVAPPAGPVHQRYAGAPWPFPGFDHEEARRG